MSHFTAFSPWAPSGESRLLASHGGPTVSLSQGFQGFVNPDRSVRAGGKTRHRECDDHVNEQ